MVLSKVSMMDSTATKVDDICSVRKPKKDLYSDTGNRTPICSVRANRDSHYTISEIDEGSGMELEWLFLLNLKK